MVRAVAGRRAVGGVHRSDGSERGLDGARAFVVRRGGGIRRRVGRSTRVAVAGAALVGRGSADTQRVRVAAAGDERLPVGRGVLLAGAGLGLDRRRTGRGDGSRVADRMLAEATAVAVGGRGLRIAADGSGGRRLGSDHALGVADRTVAGAFARRFRPVGVGPDRAQVARGAVVVAAVGTQVGPLASAARRLVVVAVAGDRHRVRRDIPA